MEQTCTVCGKCETSVGYRMGPRFKKPQQQLRGRVPTGHRVPSPALHTPGSGENLSPQHRLQVDAGDSNLRSPPAVKEGLWASSGYKAENKTLFLL